MAYDEQWHGAFMAGYASLNRELMSEAWERQDAMLREAIEAAGSPKVLAELQSRLDRQRRELARLQARVVRQRNLLRRIQELGRDLTDEERRTAEAQLDDETRKLIADELGLLFWK